MSSSAQLPQAGSSVSLSDSVSVGEGVMHTPLFLHDKLQVFVVRGNYMTLAVKPKAVEFGEWVAHQGMFVSSQYRRVIWVACGSVWGYVKVHFV